jgi:HK97 gp10 family phage protein
MRETIRMDFPNGQQLAEALRALADETRGAVLAAALEQGAEPIHAAAVERASVHRGPRRRPEAVPLAETIHIAVERVGKESATVGVGTNSKIAHLVEFGHELVRGDKTVGHVPAYPFLRPAMDDNVEEAVAIIGESLGDTIEKVFHKQAPHEGS